MSENKYKMQVIEIIKHDVLAEQISILFRFEVNGSIHRGVMPEG